MTLSKEEAFNQIFEEIADTNLKNTPDLEIQIRELLHKIVVLGKTEKKHDILYDHANSTIKIIFEHNPDLNPKAIKICEILENAAPLPEAKEMLKRAFRTTKENKQQSKINTKEEAFAQISKIFSELGVEPPKTNTNDFIQRIKVLGAREKMHSRLEEESKLFINHIIDSDPKLINATIKICEIFENTAPNEQSKEALTKAFIEVKIKYSNKEKLKGVKKSLDMVQDSITKLSREDSVINAIDPNGKISKIVNKMNAKLESTQNYGERANIMLNSLDEINLYVTKAAKISEKSKTTRALNYLKCCTKVICTLGINKSAKQDLNLAKIMLKTKNVSLVKKLAKPTVKKTKSFVDIVKNERKNYNKINTRG